MPDLHRDAPAPSDLDALLEVAVRAPSLLNSQPWRFVVSGTGVLLFADRERQLSALDPDGRELTMSCGAALYYLRVAARHAGWAPGVLPFPGGDADLLAAVTFEPTAPPSDDDRHYRALFARHTNRRPFADAPVPLPVLVELAQAAAAEGASLAILDTQDEKDALADLVRDGVLTQGSDREVTADIERWLRPDGDPRPDGVRDGVQGIWDRHAAMRTPPSSVAAYKSRLIRETPAALVLTTDGDTEADWLAAGQALARVLVTAADHGLAASYANEPVEVDALRSRVSSLVGGQVSQAVFRVGAPQVEPATSRRGVRDVVDHLGDDA